MTAWRGKIKIALITGQHPFVVQDLQGFFRSIDEVDCYPQHMEDFVNDIGSARHINRETHWGHPHLDYDVLVFYNMQRRLPTPRTASRSARSRSSSCSARRLRGS